MSVFSFVYAIIFNIDSFGIGITYGLKNTKIPIFSACILFFISYISMVIAIQFAHSILLFLPSFIGNYLGSILLISIGTWFILQAIRAKKENIFTLKTSATIGKSKVYSFFIKPLGITIEIIRNPIYSDLNCSKKIEAKEACFLGLAMSIDSVFSGMVASTMSINSVLFPFLIAFFQLVFLFLGVYVGTKIKSISNIPENTWAILSGIMLILVGFAHL